MTWGTDQWQVALGAASLILAILVAVVPGLRRVVAAPLRAITRLVGSDRRRYRTWFTGTHGVLVNLRFDDQREELSLRDTYVPLATHRDDGSERVAAVQVLQDPEARRLIIVGDPGAGKSTLLKAFGTALVRGDREVTLPGRHTPVLVQLRGLARWLAGRPADPRLVTYLAEQVLRPAGVRQPHALLGDGRVVLLLDGLDEVPDESRDDVRSAILQFVDRYDARVVLTCRRQNFLAVRAAWIPALAGRTHALARLTDDEIRAFAARRAGEFRDGRTPAGLFTSIVDSGTLDLHRVPLILTVSISLYTKLAGYRVPTSLTRFYEEMIKQLVTRHDFRLDAHGSVNRFAAEDKLRVLREFALRTASRTGRFEDFALAELVGTARELADRLPSMDRGSEERFANEIVDRSGLVAQVSLESDYVFAHRSMQEFLIAQRLLGDPRKGVDVLVEHATDDEWWLVTTFFAAFEHDQVGALLAKLRVRRPDLCARCLAVATVADRDLATGVVEDLRRRVVDGEGYGPAFGALVGLANAALPWVREIAVVELLRCLVGYGIDRAELQSLDRDSVARLIAGLAAAPADEAVVDVVGELAELPAADAPTIVGPLWRLFWPETYPLDENRAPLGRALLRLARTPDGLRELQAQPAPAVPVPTTGFDAYPFRDGLPRDSNLPLLLRTVRSLYGFDPSPEEASGNAYVSALASRNNALITLERDRRRRAVSVELFQPARMLTAGGFVAAVLLIVAGIVRQGVSTVAIDPDGSWWLNLLYLIPGAAALVIAVAMAELVARQVKDHMALPGLLVNGLILERRTDRGRQRLSRYWPDVWMNLWQRHGSEPIEPANQLVMYIDRRYHTLGTHGAPIHYLHRRAVAFAGACTVLVLPLVVAVRTVLPPADAGWAVYLVTATVVVWLMFWLPATYLCCEGVKLHLRRRNPLIGLYDDPHCGHWLVPLP